MHMDDKRPLVIGTPFLHEAGREVIRSKYRLIESADIEHLSQYFNKAAAFYGYPPFYMTREVIARAPNLRVISASGSGVDYIDVDAAVDNGVVVAHNPGVGALSVAEHVIALILSVAKGIVENDKFVRETALRLTGGDRSVLDGMPWGDRRQAELYVEISGLTLVIVGYGSIGRELAKIAAGGFGMDVIAVNSSGRDIGDPNVKATMPLDEALSLGDVVSLNVPLTEATRGLIGKREFAMMKSGAIFIDTSRGGVADHGAMADSLRSGHLRGAGIDVFGSEPAPSDYPALKAPNVIVTPHSAGISVTGSRRLSLASAAAIDDALNGRCPKKIVGSLTDWQNSRAAKFSG